MWRMAPFEFDAPTFFDIWHRWQNDPQRPDVLHVLTWAQQAPTAQSLLAQSQDTAWHNLGQELAAQCWGLLPGLHRLRLSQGRVHLSLWVGDESPLTEQLGEQPTCFNNALATPTGSVVIIGSGIAGAASARALAERGWQVRVLDAASHIAAGASGLPLGLVAPHTSPDDALISRLSRAGVRCMQQTMQRLLIAGEDWASTGVQERRLPGKTRKGCAPASWSSPELAPAAQAWSRPDTTHPATLWHEKGAWVKPARLVQALLNHPQITWQGQQKVQRLHHDRTQNMWQIWQGDNLLAQADRVVVAAGPASAALIASAQVAAPSIQPLRGQLSWGLMAQAPQLVPLAHPVNGNGSFACNIPTSDGLAWFCGSSYDRQHNSHEVFEADTQDNFSRLSALLPDTAHALRDLFTPCASPELRSWAGVRASVPDRLPLMGEVAGAPAGLWTLCALGSRGLTLGVLCGELLAAMWHNEPLAIEPHMLRSLRASRFADKIKS